MISHPISPWWRASVSVPRQCLEWLNTWQVVYPVFRGVWYISNIMCCFLQQQDAAFDHDDNECLRLLDALLEPLQIVTAASYKNSCEMKYVRMSWTASKWRKSLVAHGRISHRICEFILGLKEASSNRGGCESPKARADRQTGQIQGMNL